MTAVYSTQTHDICVRTVYSTQTHDSCVRTVYSTQIHDSCQQTVHWYSYHRLHNAYRTVATTTLRLHNAYRTVATTTLRLHNAYRTVATTTLRQILHLSNSSNILHTRHIYVIRQPNKNSFHTVQHLSLQIVADRSLFKDGSSFSWL